MVVIAEVFEVGMLGVASPAARARYSSNPSNAKAYNSERKHNTADRPSEIAPCSVVNPIQVVKGPVNGVEIHAVQHKSKR